jgi:hypothetical protein
MVLTTSTSGEPGQIKPTEVLTPANLSGQGVVPVFVNPKPIEPINPKSPFAEAIRKSNQGADFVRVLSTDDLTPSTVAHYFYTRKLLGLTALLPFVNPESEILHITSAVYEVNFRRRLATDPTFPPVVRIGLLTQEAGAAALENGSGISLNAAIADLLGDEAGEQFRIDWMSSLTLQPKEYLYSEGAKRIYEASCRFDLTGVFNKLQKMYDQLDVEGVEATAMPVYQIVYLVETAADSVVIDSSTSLNIISVKKTGSLVLPRMI